MKTCTIVAYDEKENLVIDWVKTFNGKTSTAFNRFQKSIDRHCFDNGIEFKRSEMEIINHD